MDYRVWASMALVCFFSLGLYGYNRIRLHYSRVAGCVPDTILVDNKRIDDIPLCDLNRLILFKLQKTAGTVIWDFGDGTGKIEGQLVQHTYTKMGRFPIVATVGGTCNYEGVIAVTNPLDLLPPKTVVEIFADPANPKTGQTITFTSVPNIPARSYEWKVSGSDSVLRDSIATFKFDVAGTYTVQLIINNDIATRKLFPLKVGADTPPQPDLSKNGAGTVTSNTGFPVPPITSGDNPFNGQNNQQQTKIPPDVKPGGNKPDTSKQIPPKPTVVDANAFKDLLQQVVNEEKEIGDLYEYLDYKGSTMVKVNAEETLVPLREFCKKMQSLKKKKRKIESVSFKKDDKNSIGSIQVKIPDNEGFFSKATKLFKKD